MNKVLKGTRVAEGEEVTQSTAEALEGVTTDKFQPALSRGEKCLRRGSGASAEASVGRWGLNVGPTPCFHTSGFWVAPRTLPPTASGTGIRNRWL